MFSFYNMLFLQVDLIKTKNSDFIHLEHKKDKWTSFNIGSLMLFCQFYFDKLFWEFKQVLFFFFLTAF